MVRKGPDIAQIVSVGLGSQSGCGALRDFHCPPLSQGKEANTSMYPLEKQNLFQGTRIGDCQSSRLVVVGNSKGWWNGSS